MSVGSFLFIRQPSIGTGFLWAVGMGCFIRHYNLIKRSEHLTTTSKDTLKRIRETIEKKS